jgi:hypothetical protein
MTYGVYTRDLKGVSLSERFSIDEVKKWCYKDHVVCSEKKIWCGWSITFRFHKWRGFRIRPYWNEWRFGFISIETKTHRYTWADKIVYDPLNENGENK